MAWQSGFTRPQGGGLTSSRHFFFRSVASIVDHMLLSGLNFLIGLALIRFATKETYGLYSQLFGVTVLTTSLLEAIVGSALTTLATRVKDHERAGLIARAFRIQMAVATVFALLCGLGVWVLSFSSHYEESGTQLGLAFFALIVGLSLREFCRTALYIESRPDVVASMDFLFVILTLCAGGVILWQTRLTVTEVIATLALTNGIAAIFFARRLLWPHGGNTQNKPSDEDVRALWNLSRWALIGAVVAWMVNNGYLYFAGGFLGVAALADLNAARLLLIPISIVTMAWGRVARPSLGKTIVVRDWSRLRRLIVWSTIGIEVFAVGYLAVLLWGFPWLSANLLGEKYQHVAGLLLMWGIYFAVNCARNVGTITLISFGAYRVLFWQGLSSVPVLAVGCMAAIPLFGVHGALAGMIVVELCELVVNWCFLLPKAVRQELPLE